MCQINLGVAMKKIQVIILFFLLPLSISFLLQGCYGSIASTNNSNLLKLEIGDSKSKVLEIMGNPHRNEKYQIENRTYDVWFYRTSHTPDNKETDDEFTPIVIIDGKVDGWGRNFYDNTIKIKQEIKIENKN